MEGAGRTRARLLVVLALLAGLLAGGPLALRPVPASAGGPAPAAARALAPVAPVAQARPSGPQRAVARSGPQRAVARTGAAERPSVAAPSAPAPCAPAGPCALPATVAVPEHRGALLPCLPRPPGTPPATAPSTQQDRAPPRPAGPPVP